MKKSPSEFYYNDRVKVINGFYTGLEGRISGKVSSEKYVVECRNLGNIYFEFNDLEKV